MGVGGKAYILASGESQENSSSLYFFQFLLFSFLFILAYLSKEEKGTGKDLGEYFKKFIPLSKYFLSRWKS